MRMREIFQSISGLPHLLYLVSSIRCRILVIELLFSVRSCWVGTVGMGVNVVLVNRPVDQSIARCINVAAITRVSAEPPSSFETRSRPADTALPLLFLYTRGPEDG